MPDPALTPEVLEELARTWAEWQTVSQEYEAAWRSDAPFPDGLLKRKSNLYLRVASAQSAYYPALLVAAQRVQELEAQSAPVSEMLQGTPDTPQRVATAHDADRIYAEHSENDRLRAQVQELEGATEIATTKYGIAKKMLRYIAFVLTGDESADVQLAADQTKEDRDRLRARVAELEKSLIDAGDVIVTRRGEVERLEESDRLHRAELAAIDDALGPLTAPTRQAQVRLLVERLGQSQVRDYQWIGFARSVGLAVNCLYSSFPEGNGHIVAKATQLASLAARQAEKETTT